MRRTFTAVVERCPDTGLYVGFVPGVPGAHTQAETLDELNANLKEVVEMLLEVDLVRIGADGEGIVALPFQVALGSRGVVVASFDLTAHRAGVFRRHLRVLLQPLA